MADGDTAEPSSQTEAAPGRGELWLRILSALVLAPVAIVTAYFGGWPFTVFWGLAALGIFWEWLQLVVGSTPRWVLAAGSSALATASVLMIMGRPMAAFVAIVTGIAVGIAVGPAGVQFWAAGGIPYAAIAVVMLGILRADDDYGFKAVIFLFAVVWATDVVAYFVGRAIGGPRLYASISPKKTWSGAIGGLLGGVVAGVITALVAGLSDLGIIAQISLALSAAAQAGDLFESALKRRCEVKDTGHWIPGHGGLMDRLDGFLAAVLLAAIIGLLRSDAPAQGLLLW